MEKEAKKAEKAAKRAAAKPQVEADEAEAEAGPDVSAGSYGVSPMNQSKEKPDFRFIDVSVLSSKLNEQVSVVILSRREVKWTLCRCVGQEGWGLDFQI